MRTVIIFLERFFGLPASMNFGVLTWFGVLMTIRVSTQQVAMLNIPISWLYAAIPVGAVLATGAAGYVFAWLRRRSGSLIAPIALHWSLNGLGALAAALVWHLS